MTESAAVRELFNKLRQQKLMQFPRNGYVERLDVSEAQGVYVIYNPRKIPVHVGRTVHGKRGLRQRLDQHLLGQSSFVGHYERLGGEW